MTNPFRRCKTCGGWRLWHIPLIFGPFNEGKKDEASKETEWGND